MTTLHLQEHLALAGHDPGPLDDKPGPRTTAAVRSFQRSQGLTVDGLAGPRTLAALQAPYAAAMAPPDGRAPETLGECLVEIFQGWERIGVRELPGNRGPWIRALTTKCGYAPAEGIPWCGIALWAAALVAQEWSGRAAPDLWSADCDVIAARAKATKTMFRPGLVGVKRGDLVLTRRAAGDWSHVGVVVRADGGRPRVVSGNSGDRVRTISVEAADLDHVSLP